MASTSRLVWRRSVTCSMSGVSQAKLLVCLFVVSKGSHTRNVLIQDRILVNDIVEQAFAVVVKHKDFPLCALLLVELLKLHGGCERTSPRVMCRSVLRKTTACQCLSLCQLVQYRSLSRCCSIMETIVQAAVCGRWRVGYKVCPSKPRFDDCCW